MKNVKKAYMTPMVEVMNARVEKGFAGSGSVTPTPGPGQQGDGTGRTTMPTPFINLSDPDFD